MITHPYFEGVNFVLSTLRATLAILTVLATFAVLSRKGSFAKTKTIYLPSYALTALFISYAALLLRRGPTIIPGVLQSGLSHAVVLVGAMFIGILLGGAMYDYNSDSHSSVDCLIVIIRVVIIDPVFITLSVVAVPTIYFNSGAAGKITAIVFGVVGFVGVVGDALNILKLRELRQMKQEMMVTHIHSSVRL